MERQHRKRRIAMSTETLIAVGCTCPWHTFAPTRGEALDDHLAHYLEKGGEGHQKRYEMAISGPMIPNLASLIECFKAQRKLDDARVQVERRKHVEPLRVTDDGLGYCRGLWSVLKLWGMVIGAGAACWGLWRLQ
jgi:hypothetical protein